MARTPEDRNATATKVVKRVRRRYNTKGRKREILPNERQGVIDLVVALRVAGYTKKQISAAVGVSREQVDEFLEDSSVAERIEKIRKNMAGTALELMQAYMIEAVQAVVDVMRTTEDGAVVLKAASEVLDRGGMPKASRQERVVEQEEKHTHEFGGDFVEALRNAPPEIQEKAAQMIENLETMLKDASNV